MSPGLVKRTICMNNGKLAHGDCPQRTEWFLPDHLPGEAPPEPPTPARIREPSFQLELAVDPRIPQHSQEFKFQLTRRSDYRRVDWYVDGHLQARTRKASYLWPLARGKHAVQVRVWLKGHKQYIADGPVPFLVK